MPFLDSKTLSHDNRSGLLDILSSDPANIGWSVHVIRCYLSFKLIGHPLISSCSPQDISSGMLRHPPVNLNKQAQDATIQLIREVLDSGIQLTEV